MGGCEQREGANRIRGEREQGDRENKERKEAGKYKEQEVPPRKGSAVMTTSRMELCRQEYTWKKGQVTPGEG
jgi:hypothetical protein